jgi:radical SAM protein with 4Fe4S-binding SPASM domain
MKGKLEYVDTKKLLDVCKQMAGLGLKSITIVGSGEPTIHPDFVEIISALNSYGLKIGLFTNGSGLTDTKIEAILDKLTFIRFSFNGGTKELYESVHGQKHFDLVLGNIRKIVQLKHMRKTDFPTIGVQHGTNHMTISHLLDGVKLFKGVGVDYFEIKPILFKEEKSDGSRNELDLAKTFKILEEAETLADERYAVYPKYEQFMTVLGHEEYKARNYSYCHGSFFSATLEIDGSLYVCDNQKEKKFILGNVFKERFDNIWWSKKHLDLIKSIDVTKCPVACRMDPLCRIVHDIAHPPEQIHPDFL